MEMALKKLENDRILPLFAACFAVHSLPLRLIDAPEFRAAVEAYRSGNCALPNRQQLRAEQSAEAQRMRADLVRKLRVYCRAAPLTLAIDGWTNVRRDKVTNVIILCGGVAYYWCSIVNGRAANSAEWMTVPITKVLDDLRAEGLPVAALSTDNERVNRTLHTLLQPTFKFLVRSPCAAHILQLLVHGALDLPSIQDNMILMEQLLNSFRPKAMRIQLKNVQLEAAPVDGRKRVAYKLIKPCDTRWSSHLFAARRLIKLQRFIDVCTPRPRSFWDTLAEIVRFLSPFQIATDVMQRDTSSLYDIYQQFSVIIKHVETTPSSSCFWPVRADIFAIIEFHWNKHVNVDAVIMSAELRFDESVSAVFGAARQQAAQRWFINFATEYAWHYHLTDKATIEQVKEQAMEEWMQFVTKMPVDGPISCGFDQILEDAASLRRKQQRDNLISSFSEDCDGETSTHHHSRWNPIPLWVWYFGRAPVIAHAAVAILAVAASEASVERTFSAQDAVHTKKRNRLLDESVEEEMFIKFNTRAMQRKPHTSHLGSYIELDDNMEQVEEVPRLALLLSGEAKAAARESMEVDEKEEKEVVQAAEVDEEEEAELPERPQVSRVVPPRASNDDLLRFIQTYVRENGIHANYKWKAHLYAHLSSAATSFTPPILNTDIELKKKIMAYVRDEEIEENPDV
jgi:hypothetical protein